MLAAMAMRRRALMETLDLAQDGRVSLTFEGPNGPIVTRVAFVSLEQTPLIPLSEALGVSSVFNGPQSAKAIIGVSS